MLLLVFATETRLREDEVADRDVSVLKLLVGHALKRTTDAGPEVAGSLVRDSEADMTIKKA